MGTGNFSRALGLVLAAGCGSSAPGATGTADSTPFTPMPGPAPAAAARRDPVVVERLICEPRGIEACVCKDNTTGGRRCNAAGTGFGSCDACPEEGSSCGARSCGPVRIALIGMSLPACCPPRTPDECGIDVGFVARNHGLTLGCLERDAPGQPDETCPSAEVPVPEHGLLTFAGCRTPEGRCGYDVDVPDEINLGCVVVKR